MNEQTKEKVALKDEMVEDMVLKLYRNLRELGEIESIEEIFGRLPISRIQKNQYHFLFDSIKQSVENSAYAQNAIQKILVQQAETIAKMPTKHYNAFNFDGQIEAVYDEKLQSGIPIYKSILFIRNQPFQSKKEGGKLLHSIGEKVSFLPDQSYLHLEKVKFEIGDVKMFLEQLTFQIDRGTPPLRAYDLEFSKHNHLEFSDRSFPDMYQIDKRAEVLAKIYSLQLFRSEGKIVKELEKKMEAEEAKKRDIKKIQQELEVENLKESEMIEEMDLVKQVYKIYSLIETKMNKDAYMEFTNKDAHKAATIKKSLQKLKKQLNDEISVKVKLKTLINYKYKKGW